MREFMHTMTYEIHGLGCIKLTLILKSWVLDQVLVFGSTYLIRVFWKVSVVIMFVEYLGCVDPCGIYVIVLC